MTNVHIYAPPGHPIIKYRCCERCSIRGRKRRWLVVLYAWHEANWTCLNCGQTNAMRWRGDTSVRKRQRNLAQAARYTPIPREQAFQAMEQEF